MADGASLSLTVDLALAGLTVGSAAALSGIGLVVTHRATGVLNLAQGAQAMATAYLLRELVVVQHWPTALAAAFCLLVAAPALGLLLDALVFRPLQRRGAGPAETMVACLGVFVLLIGTVVLLWGTAPLADAPSLVPATPITLPGGHLLRLDTAVQLGVVLGLALLVGAVTRFTGFGARLRAVVDNRRLAELAGVDADRVSAAGWAFGSFTAGLVGVLLAPFLLLDPYGLPLLVMETMAVAVVARLRSLPVAVVTGLALGIAQSELTRLRPGGQLLPLVQSVQVNLFVVALLVAALWGAGRTVGDGGPQAVPGGGRPAASLAGQAARAAGTVLLLLPLGFQGDDLRRALLVPALALVLLSVVVVTGYGGQISLGQAGYAGLGSLGTALLISGRIPGIPALPPVAALLVAVLVTAPLGLLTGWPAIRRSGLALALVTFAVGTAMSRFVFEQPYATNGLTLDRPAFLAGDRAFYTAELLLLGAGLLLVRKLHGGRLGRALTAMRDHQAGAAAAGVDVPRLKLLAFTAGAGLAALGGGLMGLAGRAFDASAFDPVQGLVWFATVVVVGADSAVGAVLAAALLVGLDAGTAPGISAVVVGALAMALGRMPGGLAGVARRAVRWGEPRPVPVPAERLSPAGVRTRERLAERLSGRRRDGVVRR
ncbi:ABC transporter permease [Kitasatospora sp. MAP5-34]|uniref:ABC transporter permease subunit n=1 Tax=Kitasatospora sp. MAP5-34 TaxID=3035102 RepID=UPI002474BF6C|nr:ABC transporter permease [Kitasatospora sp. MAP5-34]MDH6576843.1 branched-subunit amino acid ABC-type transport system permease component [Kitasatospora sp. MAP5-34]